MSSELYAEIEKLLSAEVVDRHSFFQLKYFVVGKEPTNQAKMWRCLNEMRTRKDSIDAINLEMEETKDTLELIDIEESRMDAEKVTRDRIPGVDFKDWRSWTKSSVSTSPENELNAKELKIRKRQISRKRIAIQKSLSDLEKKLKSSEDEASFFLHAFTSLVEVEPLKPYDDIESQKEYWNEKLSQEFNLKVLLQHQPDTELVKTILAMNDDSEIKKQTVHILNQTQQKLINRNNQEMEVLMEQAGKGGEEGEQTEKVQE